MKESITSPVPWNEQDFFDVKESIPEERISRVLKDDKLNCDLDFMDHSTFEKYADNSEYFEIIRDIEYLGKDFTCKKCGYTFTQQFLGIGGYDKYRTPKDIANEKMLNHLKNFHIVEIIK